MRSEFETVIAFENAKKNYAKQGFELIATSFGFRIVNKKGKKTCVAGQNFETVMECLCWMEGFEYIP